jgi:hypothetical protein
MLRMKLPPLQDLGLMLDRDDSLYRREYELFQVRRPGKFNYLPLHNVAFDAINGRLNKDACVRIVESMGHPSGRKPNSDALSALFEMDFGPPARAFRASQLELRSPSQKNLIIRPLMWRHSSSVWSLYWLQARKQFRLDEMRSRAISSLIALSLECSKIHDYRIILVDLSASEKSHDREGRIFDCGDAGALPLRHYSERLRIFDAAIDAEREEIGEVAEAQLSIFA